MLSSSSPSTMEQPSRNGNWETVSSDVVRSHILTRLDGVSLAALSCTCSSLNSLCSEESLWKAQCSTTWPSTFDTRVERIIATFPAGHRSFFSDSVGFLAHGGEINLPHSVNTTELISAVDVFYKDEVIFSTVQVTETASDWFLCSPMRIDLVDPKESISTVVLIDQWEDDDMWKENLSLNWLFIDPTRKRAADVSTRKPVSVYRHWLTGEVHVRFSTIFVVGCNKRRSEQVEFAVTMVLAAAATRREDETAELEIRELSLVAEDMEGKNRGGRESLFILTAAMGLKRRRIHEGEGKERYRDFMNMKTAKKEMKWRREKEMVVETAACLVGVVLLGFLLCCYLFIHKNMVVIMKKLK